jgi:hypothetical protein
MHLPAVCSTLTSLHQRRSDGFSRLDFFVFKPNRLLYLCSFQIDQVKAK